MHNIVALLLVVPMGEKAKTWSFCKTLNVPSSEGEERTAPVRRNRSRIYACWRIPLPRLAVASRHTPAFDSSRTQSSLRAPSSRSASLRVPMGGIEPPSELYEGSALPLSYTGICVYTIRHSGRFDNKCENFF